MTECMTGHWPDNSVEPFASTAPVLHVDINIYNKTSHRNQPMCSWTTGAIDACCLPSQHTSTHHISAVACSLTACVHCCHMQTFRRLVASISLWCAGRRTTYISLSCRRRLYYCCNIVWRYCDKSQFNTSTVDYCQDKWHCIINEFIPSVITVKILCIHIPTSLVEYNSVTCMVAMIKAKHWSRWTCSTMFH